MVDKKEVAKGMNEYLTKAVKLFKIPPEYADKNLRISYEPHGEQSICDLHKDLTEGDEIVLRKESPYEYALMSGLYLRSLYRGGYPSVIDGFFGGAAVLKLTDTNEIPGLYQDASVLKRICDAIIDPILSRITPASKEWSNYDDILDKLEAGQFPEWKDIKPQQKATPFGMGFREEILAKDVGFLLAQNLYDFGQLNDDVLGLIKVRDDEQVYDTILKKLEKAK